MLILLALVAGTGAVGFTFNRVNSAASKQQAIPKPTPTFDTAIAVAGVNNPIQAAYFDSFPKVTANPSVAAADPTMLKYYQAFKVYKSAKQNAEKAKAHASFMWWNPINPEAEDKAANALQQKAITAYELSIKATDDNPILVDDKTCLQWLFEDCSYQLWARYQMNDDDQMSVNYTKFTTAFAASVSKLAKNPPLSMNQSASIFVQHAASVVGIVAGTRNTVLVG